jgi:hypothetical protein
MNRPLQTTAEQIPITYNIFKNWHPYYADLTGNTPCYYEFMELMTCMNNNTNKMLCSSKYYKLLQCLKKNGFNF